MPYVEILAPRASESNKRTVVDAVTGGIVQAFGVAPSTVTIYFVAVADGDYAHEGRLGAPAAGGRVFAKVHAYRRSADERRAAAQAMTPAIAACFDTAPDNVAVYFMDRELDEVAHAGQLSSDEEPRTTTTA